VVVWVDRWMLDVRYWTEQSRVGQLEGRARKRFNTRNVHAGQGSGLRQASTHTKAGNWANTRDTARLLSHALLSPALHVHKVPVTAERLIFDSKLPSHSNFSAALRIALSARLSIRRRCEHCPLASPLGLQGCVAPHSLRQPCQL
jgi:hypothetical protein